MLNHRARTQFLLSNVMLTFGNCEILGAASRSRREKEDLIFIHVYTGTENLLEPIEKDNTTTITAAKSLIDL